MHARLPSLDRLTLSIETTAGPKQGRWEEGTALEILPDEVLAGILNATDADVCSAVLQGISRTSTALRDRPDSFWHMLCKHFGFTEQRLSPRPQTWRETFKRWCNELVLTDIKIQQAVRDCVLGNYVTHTQFGHISTWYTRFVTNMSYLFDYKNKYKYAERHFGRGMNLELRWDTRNVTDMSGMFCGAAHFNNGGHTLEFDTRKVTNMAAMFSGAAFFNQKLGSNFVTSRVQFMNQMFLEASNFNHGGEPLSLDTKNVITMHGMFQHAIDFNQPLGKEFNTGNVLTVSRMFENAKSFNQPLGDKFDTSKVVDMSFMFFRAAKFNQPLGDKFDTSNVVNMSHMFFEAVAFDQADSLARFVLRENVDRNNIFAFAYALQKHPAYSMILARFD
jgi:hypothetical protein